MNDFHAMKTSILIGLFLLLASVCAHAQLFNKTYPIANGYEPDYIVESLVNYRVGARDNLTLGILYIELDGEPSSPIHFEDNVLTQTAPPVNFLNVYTRAGIDEFWNAVEVSGNEIKLQLVSLFNVPAPVVTIENNFTFTSGNDVMVRGVEIGVNGVLIFGTYDLPNAGPPFEKQYWVIATNFEGDEIWRYSSDVYTANALESEPELSIPTVDGGVIVKMLDTSDEASERLIKISDNGNFVATLSEFSNNSFISIESVARTGSSIFVEARLNTNGNGDTEFLERYDNQGTLINNYGASAALGTIHATIGFSDIDAYDFDDSGNLTMAGNCFCDGSLRFYFLQLSEDGSLNWVQTYEDFNPVTSIIQSISDDGYVLSGYLDNDFWVGRTDEEGNLPPLSNSNNVDLELNLTSSNPNPGVFGNLTITATVTNNGSAAANDIMLEFPSFPANLPVTGAPMESQGAFSNWWTGTGTWDVGTLEAGEIATVDIGLFPLTENIDFYGEISVATGNDIDSSPGNGTSPTPNEDDEAVITINDTSNGPCSIETTTLNIGCFDNGTSSDSSDDVWSFDLNVVGTNASDSYLADINGQTFSGNYGEDTSFGLFPISEGDITVNLVDAVDPSCSEFVQVVAPAPCSNGGNQCGISIANLEITCFDNGTADPSDDQFRLDMEITGMNNSMFYNATIPGPNQLGGGNDLTNSYDLMQSIAIYNIAEAEAFFNGGPISFTLSDSQFPNCTTEVVFDIPAPCSDPMGSDIDLELSMSSSTMNPSVFSNGTVVVTVTNTSTVLATNIQIEVPSPVGYVYQGGNEFTSSQGDFNFNGNQVWSALNLSPNESATLELNYFFLAEPTGIANYAQVISVEQNDVDSTPDNGTCCTPNEDDEAVFTFGGMVSTPDLSVSDFIENWPTPLQIGVEYPFVFDLKNIGAATAVGNYRVGVYLSTDGFLSTNDYLIGDVATGDTPVGTISGVAGLVEVTANVPAGSYFVLLVADDMDDILETNENNNIQVSDNTYTVDNVIGGCQITAVVNSDCNDNGSPNDPSDDIWFVEINPTGSNLGAMYDISGDLQATDVLYGVPQTFGGGGIISEPSYTFTVTDESGDCSQTVTIDAPMPCSNGGSNGVDLELNITSASSFGQYQNVSFEVNLTNAGIDPVENMTIYIYGPEGGVFSGGNEGEASSGTFFPTNDGVSTWDLSDLAGGDTEVLTMSIFVLDPNEVTIWAEVEFQSTVDDDSTPSSYFPVLGVPLEDDEDRLTLSNGPTSAPLIGVNSSNIQATEGMLFRKIFPNPTTDFLKLEVASSEVCGAVLQIVNVSGNVVQQLDIELVKGENLVELEVSTLPRGVYFLKMETATDVVMKRFLKE